MPLTRIEVEQLAGNRWVAEVEVGGISCRRYRLAEQDFDTIMSAIWTKYREHYPDQDQQTPPPMPEQAIDRASLPEIKPARSREDARRMRLEADRLAAARDPGLPERRRDLERRR